jgi:hypothetical protein
MNGNIDNCKNYLTQRDFWIGSKEEVTNMLPQIALKTLESLQFYQIEEYNELQKMNVVKVVSVNDWLKILNNLVIDNKLQREEYIKIQNNDKLIGYLHMLVDKINSNPQILNPTFIKQSEHSINNNVFKNTRLHKLGLKPFQQPQNNTFTSINRIFNLININQNYLKLQLLPQYSKNIIMTGGSIIYQEYSNKLTNEQKHTSNIFKQIFEQLKLELKQNNKQLNSNDKNLIDVLINQLKNSEKKLMELIIIVDKYNRLLNIYNEKDGQTIINIDYLQKFVKEREHQFNKVTKKQNSLMEVFTQLLEQTTKPVTPQPVQRPLRKEKQQIPQPVQRPEIRQALRQAPAPARVEAAERAREEEAERARVEAAERAREEAERLEALQELPGVAEEPAPVVAVERAREEEAEQENPGD